MAKMNTANPSARTRIKLDPLASPATRRPVCEAILAQASCLGEEKLAEIPLELLRVDTENQRNISGARWGKVANMAASFSTIKSGVLLVSYRPEFGLFFVIDGQGRLEAAKRVGKQVILCSVLQDMTLRDEAELFLSQDDNVCRVSGHDKAKAGVIAEHAECLTLRDTMHKYGIVDMKEISAIGSVLSIAANNPRELDWLMGVITASGWNEMKNGYSQMVVKALHLVYEREFEKLARVEQVLIPIMKMNSPNIFRSVAELTCNQNKSKYSNVYTLFSAIISENNKRFLKKLTALNLNIPALPGDN